MKKETAKVNKEIGGWDYRGYHIDHDKNIKSYVVDIMGDEVAVKSLGEAKKVIDEQVDYSEQEARKADAELKGIITWVSKRGTEYLLQVVDGTIKAFTYEKGKKHYWTVTKEIREFASAMMM